MITLMEFLNEATEENLPPWLWDIYKQPDGNLNIDGFQQSFDNKTVYKHHHIGERKVNPQAIGKGGFTYEKNNFRNKMLTPVEAYVVVDGFLRTLKENPKMKTDPTFKKNVARLEKAVKAKSMTAIEKVVNEVTF